MTVYLSGGTNAGRTAGDRFDSIENVIGSNYNDRLFGSSEQNLLSGGVGNDSLRGGADADFFVFGAGGGRDVISDFQDGIDRIDFRGSGIARSSIRLDSVFDNYGVEIGVTVAVDNLPVIYLAGIRQADLTIGTLTTSDIIIS